MKFIFAKVFLNFFFLLNFISYFHFKPIITERRTQNKKKKEKQTIKLYFACNMRSSFFLIILFVVIVLLYYVLHQILFPRDTLQNIRKEKNCANLYPDRITMFTFIQRQTTVIRHRQNTNYKTFIISFSVLFAH